MSGGLAFQWDGRKAEANMLKHGVPFPFAVRVFSDPERVEMDASRARDGELRRKMVGLIEGVLFTVVFTVRNGDVRVISARRASPKESRCYD